jgi:hypothetical protein
MIAIDVYENSCIIYVVYMQPYVEPFFRGSVMTLISSPVSTRRQLIAEHFSASAHQHETLVARKLGDIMYVIELNAGAGPAGQRTGTVTIGTLTAGKFVGHEPHQGLISLPNNGQDLIVRAPKTGYVLMHAVGIEEVTRPS